MRQIVLDTETTGLSPKQGHRLTEIGCIEIYDRQLTGAKFHSYLNPERSIDDGAKAITGLTEEFLKDKPTFAEIVDPFLDFVADSEIIIHNAPFDVGFINHELNLLSHPWGHLESRASIFDTLTLARKMFPGQRNSLDALCNRYKVSNEHRKLHGALLDAEILAEVYLQMTAGQIKMSFSHSTENTSSNSTSQGLTKIPRPTRQLKVVAPTDTELQEHRASLLQMQTNSGDCLWLKLEEN